MSLLQLDATSLLRILKLKKKIYFMLQNTNEIGIESAENNICYRILNRECQTDY